MQVLNLRRSYLPFNNALVAPLVEYLDLKLFGVDFVVFLW